MQYELRKLLSSKKLAVVVSLLLFNLFFFILFSYGSGQNAGVIPSAYKAVFSSMKGMSNREKTDYLETFLKERSGDASGVEDYERIAMVEQLLEDSRIISDYEAYLTELEEGVETKSVMSRLSGAGEFGEKNSEKMRIVYRSLHGTNVSFEPAKGIELIDQTVTNMLLVFLIFYFALTSLIQEEEDGCLPILRCCKNGRGRLLGYKIGSLGVLSFLLSGVFLLENLLFGYFAYGTGNLLRPIQSLPGYESSPFRINVLTFILLIWLIRSMTLFLFAMFVLLLSVLTYQIVVVCIGYLLAGGIFFGLYWGISLQSSAVVFHYVNPVALLKTMPLLKGEVNLNLFELPVSPWAAAVGFGAFICITLLLLSAFAFVRTGKNNGISLPVKRLWHWKRPSRTLGGEERYKLLAVRKGLFVFMVVLAVQMVLYPRNYMASPYEIYEDGYLMQLEGEVTKEKKEWLAEELSILSRENDESARMKREVLETRICPLYFQLHAKQEQNGNAEFIRQSGYEKLFGVQN